MNHTRFPKEEHLPDWERRDNKDTKGNRVECEWHVEGRSQHLLGPASP